MSRQTPTDISANAFGVGVRSSPQPFTLGPVTQAAGELLVIDRIDERVLWRARHIAGVPRNHRFTLGERRERRLYDLLELLLKAKYRGQKAGLASAG